MLSEDLIKLSRGVLGGVRSAARFFFWSPRAPLGGSGRPRGLPRTVWSVFENVKKNVGFYGLFGHGGSSWPSREAIGRAVGSPGPPPQGVWELDRVIGGGPRDLSSAPPSFRRGPWGGPGRKSDIFDDFGRVKFLHEYRLGPRDPLGKSRERFEEVSGVKIA